MDTQLRKSSGADGWLPDYIDGFGMKYIDHLDDYSGHVRCTVICKKADAATPRAILYVHGFSDYFLQKEMGGMFAANGYDFYAVDLRKYGRSLVPGQRLFQVRDLHEYFADIDSAIEVIKEEGHDEIMLLGHSTGGLTTSLYMSEHPSPLVKALMLNSPFLDWNLPPLLKDVAMPVVSSLGRFFPNVRVHQKPDAGYAESLHRIFGGEWDYRRDWKPDVLPDPDMGWVRAIDRAQRELRRRKIEVPILLMRSEESVKSGDTREKSSRADAILDVEAISRYGRRLGSDVTEVAFPGGLHDLALSRKKVREEMYRTMLVWLAGKGL